MGKTMTEENDERRVAAEREVEAEGPPAAKEKPPSEAPVGRFERIWNWLGVRAGGCG
jgi:hypothetical protein